MTHRFRSCFHFDPRTQRTRGKAAPLGRGEAAAGFPRAFKIIVDPMGCEARETGVRGVDLGSLDRFWPGARIGPGCLILLP